MNACFEGEVGLILNCRCFMKYKKLEVVFTPEHGMVHSVLSWFTRHGFPMYNFCLKYSSSSSSTKIFNINPKMKEMWLI